MGSEATDFRRPEESDSLSGLIVWLRRPPFDIHRRPSLSSAAVVTAASPIPYFSSRNFCNRCGKT